MAKASRKSPRKAGRKLPAEPLTQEEVLKLIRSCSRRALTGVRNAALIAVMYRSGLRLGEALALKPKDVDAANCTIRVLHGKGDKSRVVGIDDQACSFLSRWMDKRKELGLTGRHPVFCTITAGNGSTPGQPLEQAYVRVLLPRLAKKAGIVKRVHAHGLRHTHAFELAQEGTPLHVIQKQLGHASLQITSRYVDHLLPSEVIETVRRRTWKG